MTSSKRWQSKTALMMALGLMSTAMVPVVTATRVAASEAVVAQVFSQQSQQVGIPSGTVIPVTYTEAERIVLTPEETSDVTLTVETDIRSSRGTVLIPRGSQIEGQLRPADGGSQFVADEVVLPSGRRYSINAASDVVTRTETITEESDPDFLRGAAIGAAAAAVLSEVFGDIDFIEVLAGAGVGALASVLLGGNDREVEVVVVEPETDLDLTLQSDFVLTSSLLRSR
ncbi:hypothetical protein H6G89_10690 [Oscillatoria sp. FACHB-1407]|uniref:hypothetical protein n=1 Tax=Oscillatoria sp. FACHB-1407 TaxID=2692847 RepID=UPI001686EFA6|nr:hypothetical protein [Oscillatoria sp. FACHB-1407]MBD2461516.1 hypothetical protein [Oscillatoria sp. FACHB-1407]